ncbi:LysR family transcriptional regulator [Microbulbifer flavimaris]|uniref:LysR family transcriptional regulator n=1 Tax=Microbulbifer flavimaris TaxID=1781068 RepID=A0ABX4I1H1_9GAMM|nr:MULTISPECIES: LysR family transcriptional regulator [Microbulbifer]KUJ83484.1 LysR family transcriptional regulator [Microbulbifer sp. ZGT114]PCO05643.1 LysR family transcriptional regulator [Microbulbifer flavimaris]
MNISSKDLNLLALFKVLYEEQNLSVAAQRMALSQPALSHRLNKLRDELGDPLFVRAARGLTPTPRAHALAPEVARLVAEIEDFYQFNEGRDFLSQPDIIHIYSTDYVEQLLMPALIHRIAEQAPQLQLVTHNTRGQLPARELENGSCDIAIAGFYTDLPGTFYQQALHSEEFVVLASGANRNIKKQLTLKIFLECRHLVTTLTGDLNGVVDRALQAQGKKRRVIAGLSSFLAPPAVVCGTDMLLTCLRSIAEEACERYPDLKIYPVPLQLEPVQVVQTWHQRTHQDPMRQWLRQQIKETLST